MKAKISEIFSSIQGEGLYLGKKQIFVRFFGCNMKCAYCDTIHNYGDKSRRNVGTIPVKRLSIDEVLKRINLCLKDVTVQKTGQSQDRDSSCTVSLTGGEPLLYADYLKVLLERIKSLNFKVYLETNGTLPNALEDVIKMVDIIAMDIKLPSSTHDRSFWDEHEEFLKIAKRREVFIKIIVTGDTRKYDFEQAVRIIQGVAQTIPLVIQPVTPCGVVKKTSNAKLNNFYNYASSILENVRIIPQVHRIMGWL